MTSFGRRRRTSRTPRSRSRCRDRRFATALRCSDRSPMSILVPLQESLPSLVSRSPERLASARPSLSALCFLRGFVTTTLSLWRPPGGAASPYQVLRTAPAPVAHGMTSEHTYTGLCGKRELKRLGRLRPSPLGGRQSGAGIRHVRGPFDPGRGSASPARHNAGSGRLQRLECPRPGERVPSGAPDPGGPQSLAGPTALLDSAGRSGLLRCASARPPLAATSRLDSEDGRSSWPSGPRVLGRGPRPHARMTKTLTPWSSG